MMETAFAILGIFVIGIIFLNVISRESDDD